MPNNLIADLSSYQLLAELPSVGGYFNVLKIIVFFLAMLLWAHNAAWVQGDTKRIRVPPAAWTFSVFGAGLLCLVLWDLLIPVYWIGLLVFVLGYGTLIIIYVVFRNKRVSPAQTVLTPAHFKRLTSGQKTKLAAEAAHAKDKTRLRSFEDKVVPWPTDVVEHAAHQALQELLFDAIWRRATDVRLDFAPDQPAKVVYKVDGVDRVCEPLAPDIAPHLLTQIKTISGMDPAEQRRPQTGKFNAVIGAAGSSEKPVDIESKASGSTAGQRVMLKVIAEESKFRAPDIGLTKAQLPIFEKLIAQPKGVMVVSGPRGTGVTSTLYAILRSHDAFMQNIHTLEITKSMTLENITQHVYDGSDPSATFGNRFRSLIRTEPDVAMAGDTPDSETMGYAAAAGRQQKKIYLGMSANDTFSALRRYLDGVGDGGLAASSLVAVTNQRMVRVLCTSCRRAYKPDPALLKKGNLPIGENRPFFRPPNPEEIEVDKHGNQLICQVCQGSGYFGRSGVFELLVIDEQIRGMIAKGADVPSMKAEVRKKGMLYLQEVALYKVYEGITSIAEVLRVTKDEQPAKVK